jgi:uncharacterized membrane protein YcaP (DUF421 family)
MESVVRGFAIYLILLILFRLSGRRTLGETTTFDFVLLLIIAEAIQQGMVDDDHSLTTAILLVTTLILTDVALSLLKQRSKRVEWLVDGVPLVILEDGRPLEDRMNRERIDEEDILEAARGRHGLERLDQIKYAVLERSGSISIVPR